MKIFFLLFCSLVLVFQTAQASSRTDEILADDLQTSFQQIAQRKSEINANKRLMEKLQAKLKEARKGKATFLKIRNVAGTMAIVAIAVGAYKLTFPSGIKFTGLKLMLSSYVAVSSLNDGMIELNQADIENLSREIILSLIKISKAEKAINTELKILCRQDPRERLCYNL